MILKMKKKVLILVATVFFIIGMILLSKFLNIKIYKFLTAFSRNVTYFTYIYKGGTHTSAPQGKYNKFLVT